MFQYSYEQMEQMEQMEDMTEAQLRENVIRGTIPYLRLIDLTASRTGMGYLKLMELTDGQLIDLCFE